MPIPFKSLEALWTFPLVKDLGNLSTSLIPSFFSSVASTTYSFVAIFASWTCSFLQRIAPASLSSPFSPWKESVTSWVLQLDLFGEILIQRAGDKMPFLKERLHTVCEKLRESASDFLTRSRNNMGANAMGRWCLKFLDGILRMIERPFVPFAGAMVITEANNKTVNDTNDGKSSKGSFLLSVSNMATFGLLGRLSQIRDLILDTLRGFRKSIHQTIRIGELKVSHSEKEFFISSEGTYKLLDNKFAQTRQFHILFDALKQLLVFLQLSSDGNSEKTAMSPRRNIPQLVKAPHLEPSKLDENKNKLEESAMTTAIEPAPKSCSQDEESDEEESPKL